MLLTVITNLLTIDSLKKNLYIIKIYSLHSLNSAKETPNAHDTPRPNKSNSSIEPKNLSTSFADLSDVPALEEIEDEPLAGILSSFLLSEFRYFYFYLMDFCYSKVVG